MVGHLEAEMRPKRRMKMWVLIGTRGMRVSTALVIKTLEIKEEEVEDMGLGRGGFCGTYFHCNEEGHCAFECPQ